MCAVDCKARFVGDTVAADGQVNLEVCFRCELHTLRTSPPPLPSPRIFLFYTCTHGVVRPVQDRFLCAKSCLERLF